MSEVVKEYYDKFAEGEWKRLTDKYASIEFYSTMYLINKYFPKTGHICDIGCGAGRYSIELLKKGYEVTLFELSNKELEIAEEKITEFGLKANEYICDTALNLHLLESNKYDAILIMGPLYHILDKKDRVKVLKETRRILKKDGVAIITYLNSWGILKAGLTEFSNEFKNIENVYNYLNEQSFDHTRSFTDAYFSTPKVALDEVKSADFEIISYAGCESFLSGLINEMISLYSENPIIYENLLKVASTNCELPQYRDATEHLNIVVKNT